MRVITRVPYAPSLVSSCFYVYVIMVCHFRYYRSIRRMYATCLHSVTVVSGPRSLCVSNKPLQQTAQRGYIANAVTDTRTLGSRMCPWQIRVKPGQTINITLIDFSTLQESDDYDDVYSDQMVSDTLLYYSISKVDFNERRTFTSYANSCQNVRHVRRSCFMPSHCEEKMHCFVWRMPAWIM